MHIIYLILMRLNQLLLLINGSLRQNVFLSQNHFISSGGWSFGIFVFLQYICTAYLQYIYTSMMNREAESNYE